MAFKNPLEGVAALTKQLEALKSLDDGKAMKRCVKAGIQEVYKAARDEIPIYKYAHRLAPTYGSQLVAPGFARDNLRVISTINAAKNVASGILGVRKRAFYAVSFVNHGTSKQPANPFMQRALFKARDAAEQKLHDSLQKDVIKAAKTK